MSTRFGRPLVVGAALLVAALAVRARPWRLALGHVTKYAVSYCVSRIGTNQCSNTRGTTPPHPTAPSLLSAAIPDDVAHVVLNTALLSASIVLLAVIIGAVARRRYRLATELGGVLLGCVIALLVIDLAPHRGTANLACTVQGHTIVMTLPSSCTFHSIADSSWTVADRIPQDQGPLPAATHNSVIPTGGYLPSTPPDPYRMSVSNCGIGLGSSSLNFVRHLARFLDEAPTGATCEITVMPPIVYEASAKSPTSRPSTQPVNGVDWILAGVALALLVVLLGVVLRQLFDEGFDLGRRRRRHPVGEEGDTDDMTEGAEGAGGVAGELPAAMLALNEGSDPRSGVLRCWQRLEYTIDDRGITRRASDSPRDVVLRALDLGVTEESPLVRLRDLFNSARFSSHQISEEDRDEAHDILEQIRAAIQEDDEAGDRASDQVSARSLPRQ